MQFIFALGMAFAEEINQAMSQIPLEPVTP